MKNLIILIFVTISSSGFAQSQRNLTKNGFAAKGYDVVAYFQNNAIEGADAFTSKNDGAVYKFSTEENMLAFISNPEKYIPQYGGYCAWAVADSSQLVDVDPESFQILNSKLYLFYDGFFAHTLKKWIEEGSEKMSAEADKNWEKIKINK